MKCYEEVMRETEAKFKDTLRNRIPGVLIKNNNLADLGNKA